MVFPFAKALFITAMASPFPSWVRAPLVAALVFSMPAQIAAQTSHDQTPLLPKFYSVAAENVAGEGGTLIKSETIDAPNGAEAWRIIYRSTTAAGVPVAVSGIVIAPKDGGAVRPIVSWAHGTVGVARHCAPSNVPDPAKNFVGYSTFESDYPNDYGIPGLAGFLASGYVVVATDYQGLGAGDHHEYIISQSQARNALDIIRAAREMQPSAGPEAVVLGWSQGGLTALTAGENANYAPDINLVGVAAMAPANPAAFAESLQLNEGGNEADAAIGLLLLVNRSYSWVYDELEPSDQLTDLGVQALAATTRQCVQQLKATGLAAGGVSELVKEASADRTAAWASRFMQNAPGQKESATPVLVLQGGSDTTVPPVTTDLYIAQACQFSAPILRIVYKGKEHRPLVPASIADAASWIEDRFSDEPATSNCN